MTRVNLISSSGTPASNDYSSNYVSASKAVANIQNAPKGHIHSLSTLGSAMLKSSGTGYAVPVSETLSPSKGENKAAPAI